VSHLKRFNATFEIYFSLIYLHHKMNYSSLSVSKLKSLCKEKQIKKYSTKTKNELIELLENNCSSIEIKKSLDISNNVYNTIYHGNCLEEMKK
jgi:predicted GIY-YIG superfamily endonuclease